MKQMVVTIVLVLVIIALLVTIVYGSGNKNKPSALVFFYGNTCPHCKDVDIWMKKNKVEKTLNIQKKEVYDSATNALALKEAAKQCGLATNTIGVPFLYTPEKTCLIGTPAIIEYLKKLL